MHGWMEESDVYDRLARSVASEVSKQASLRPPGRQDGTLNPPPTTTTTNINIE